MLVTAKGLAPDCPAAAAWDAVAPKSRYRDDGLSIIEDECLKMLQSEDVKLRRAGAAVLSRLGVTFPTNQSLAQRLLKVAEKETDRQIALALGHLVAKIQFGLIAGWDSIGVDALKELLVKHPREEFRAAALGDLASAPTNENPDWTPFVISRLKDPAREVRLAIVEGLSLTPPDRIATACAAWKSLFHDSDADVSGTAIAHAVTTRCTGLVTPALRMAASRLSANKRDKHAERTLTIVYTEASQYSKAEHALAVSALKGAGVIH